MSGDETIWAACLSGDIDWHAIGGKIGVEPDAAMRRAMDIGAWWLVGLTPDRTARAERVLQSDASLDAIANVLGTDVHATLIWLGMRYCQGRY